MTILAVVGDRHYTDYLFFAQEVAAELQRIGATEIVTGDSSGTDTMARTYAEMHNIPYTVFCASRLKALRLRQDNTNVRLVSDWTIHKLAAGPIRNAKMLKTADAVLLFDGGGPVSNSVKSLARQLKKPVERREINA